MKFTIPEPPQPYCPFAVNKVAHCVLDPSGGVIYVDFDDDRTPLHIGARQKQAERAWNEWDAPAIYGAVLWPPLSCVQFNDAIITHRWLV